MLLTGAADKLGLNPLNCGREVITAVAIFQPQWKFDLTRNVCNSSLSLSLSLDSLIILAFPCFKSIIN